MTGMLGFWSAAGVVSTTLATAVIASKAISFRQFENELRNLIGEEPIIDTRWVEFPGCCVFMIFGGGSKIDFFRCRKPLVIRNIVERFGPVKESFSFDF